MIPPAVEEVLESLYLCEVEKEKQEAISAAAAAVEEAVGLGLVRQEKGEARLTESGRVAGQEVVRRHRLAECLLHNVLAASDEFMEEDACRFEHILKRQLSEKVCALLGHPAACPHGKPIPPGPCCQKARTDMIREVGALCDGKPGNEGVVAYLATRNNREVQKLMAMGVLPGSAVRLIQCFPSYVFEIGYSQFAVDRELAGVVIVHWRK